MTLLQAAPLIIAAGTVVVALLGTLLARKGKKSDDRNQDVRDQFDRMLAENEYLRGALADERSGHAQARAELTRTRTRKPPGG